MMILLNLQNWEGFTNTALKNFSSGMKARLGFAIATMNIPDILILDEVLAVGDFKFQERALPERERLSIRERQYCLFPILSTR